MIQIIKPVIITVGIVVVAYIASISANSWIRVQGVSACMSGGSTKTTITQGDQVQTYTQPDGAWYATCMRDMGYLDDKK
ncbi:MAG: hypothetical protein Q8P72_02590 [Candidatus Roizmanbacteria bacterium]|nr:hypothetical protein [Candidatus Roizmanbacteria bacterium]